MRDQSLLRSATPNVKYTTFMPVTCTAVNKEIAYCSSFDFLKVSLQFASERGIHPLLYFRIDAFPFYYCVCVAYGNVGGCYNNAAVGAMVMIGFFLSLFSWCTATCHTSVCGSTTQTGSMAVPASSVIEDATRHRVDLYNQVPVRRLCVLISRYANKNKTNTNKALQDNEI